MVGGWQPSLNPENCIEYTDYLCVGEGETAFLGLIQSLENKKNDEKIENFWINKT